MLYEILVEVLLRNGRICFGAGPVDSFFLIQIVSFNKYLCITRKKRNSNMFDNHNKLEQEDNNKPKEMLGKERCVEKVCHGSKYSSRHSASKLLAVCSIG